MKIILSPSPEAFCERMMSGVDLPASSPAFARANHPFGLLTRHNLLNAGLVLDDNELSANTKRLRGFMARMHRVDTIPASPEVNSAPRRDFFSSSS